MSDALLLCVTWDMPKLVRKVLRSEVGDKTRANVPPELHIALQRSLELQRGNVMQVIMEQPGVSWATIDMCKLYGQPDERGFLSGNTTVLSKLRAESALTTTHLDLIRSEAARMLNYATYQDALHPVFKTISLNLDSLLFKFEETRPHDVFFWLVFQSNLEMARKVPVPNPAAATTTTHIPCAIPHLALCDPRAICPPALSPALPSAPAHAAMPSPHPHHSAVVFDRAPASHCYATCLPSPRHAPPPQVWPMCDMPVHIALLGSAIAKKLEGVLMDQASQQAGKEVTRDGMASVRAGCSVWGGRGINSDVTS